MGRGKNHLVLYFYTGNSSFVAKDLLILEKEYLVKTFLFAPKHKFLTPLFFLRQFFFLLIYTPRSKTLISQFAGYHSFLPAIFSKIFRKKKLIVAGGTDCVSFPKLNYGNLRPSLLGAFTRWSYQLSSHIAPVDQSLIFQEYQYHHPLSSEKNQGVKAFLSDLKTPYTVIHNGYDDPMVAERIKRNEKQIITVAAGAEEGRRMRLKGVDLFVELALELKEYKFVVIGSSTLPITVPVNVELVPFLSNTEVMNYFHQSAFYAQLSISEGFPNALCEAMIGGCVPITTNVGAMPFIVENNGLIIHQRNTTDIAHFIQKTSKKQRDRIGESAKQSILDRFPLSQREKQLLHLVRSLTKN